MAKTLEELRALARSLGLKAYSKLNKAELLRLLAKQKSPRKKTAKTGQRARKPATPKAAAKKQLLKKPPATRPRPAAPSHPEPAAHFRPQAAPVTTDEERVETAKYALVPPGAALSARRLADLQEDIDQLPAPRQPQLTLLPQKPGVLHAYWALAPEPAARLAQLRLRLCRLADDALEVIEEITLPAARGLWYFHVPEDAEPGAYCVHLGHYDAAGHFVSAIERAIARIPTLYASGEKDRRWGVSEAQFRAMYLRAGGVVRGRRLGWPGGISSQR
ncbi:MAG: DUF4912 domain-containing protein [Pseudomonadota bacterium]|mgnify:CR=1 FL=1